MNQPQDHFPERRRRVRRRRAIAAAALGLIIVGAVATVYLLNRRHNVVVVHVAAKVHDAPTEAAPTKPAPSGEYPAAPGAPSLERVKAELAAAEGKRTSPSSSTATHTGANSGVLDAGAEGSFRRLAASMSGHVELAVLPFSASASVTLGGDEPAHGWSTTKVPVLVSLLRARGASGLTAQERSWAQSAITESSNESVLALFSDLERLEGGLAGASRYMERVLRLGGDTATTVATAPPPAGAVTTFGQTEWSPDEAARFFRSLALGCLLPSTQTSYVLGLMQRIVPSESWGLGSAGFSSVAFKGGWGPERGGYLVRQSGIVDPTSSRGVAVAIVAVAPSFSVGTEMLTRTASWLSRHLRPSAGASAGCAR
ncbi:MAG TPA: hypothetical protein VMB05_18105 [Solirubrobacteraceae bacterium]|nr:hypothetical protein [Solirubrobacteraceae bacterium]